MKNEHTSFITSLLSNPKLSSDQRDKVVELALRDLSKNGSEKRILHDLELIKEKLEIKAAFPKAEINGSKNTKGPWIDILTTNESGKNNWNNFTQNGDHFTDEDFKGFMGDDNKEEDNKNDKEDILGNPTSVNTMAIEKIEDKLKKVMDPEIVLKDTKPKYYYPNGLYKYLFEYNQNPILRSTCHKIDSNELSTINKYCNTETYHFEKHLNKILEAFDEHDKLFAPSRVKALIRGYLTGMDFEGNSLKSGWSSDSIKFSWSSNELKGWCEKNKNFPPCPDPGLIDKNENVGFEFSEAIRLNSFNKYIKTFSELIIHFKHLFHIRQDNSLKKLLQTQNVLNNWNDQIDFEIRDEEFPSNIELFTDVDKLIQAYKKIIELILEQKSNVKPIVKLSFYQKKDSVELSIFHANTFYRKSLIDAEERPLGQTYSGLIENQINGMCNLYVRANFGQRQFAEINIWNGKPRKAKPLESFDGVEHIFEFRKK